MTITEIRVLKTVKKTNEKRIAFAKEWYIPSNAKPYIASLIEENREIKRQLKGAS